MKSPFISRVKIQNFRNFKNVDIILNSKAIIIGENNIGKTNFLRALQLILDSSLSDDDRNLTVSDFNEELTNPMENNEEIVIQIYISGYSDNKVILSMLNDAMVLDNEEEKLLLTYKFFPYEFEDGRKEYTYSILKGAPEKNKKFTCYDRKYLNLKVIKPLRDVESEMRNSKISPINKILKEYNFDSDDLEEIAASFVESSSKILSLDEIKDATSKINKRFSEILGNESFNLTFGTQEIDPNKILSSMKVMMSNRSIHDISLGLNNIIYISLIIQLLQDKTIPSLLKKNKYEELSLLEGSEIIDKTYTKTAKGNYVLNSNIEQSDYEILHTFMDENIPNSNGVTFLAIEEPEAHLHPIYQRLIYKDIINKSNGSVLMTTHSPHITSIAPINTIVHLHSTSNKSTEINTSASLNLGNDEKDIERYLDIRRGEIYLCKGVILVEGVTEEYIVPQYAKLLNKPLDEKGIIICNINSTNFKPYIKLLSQLKIPYAVITDGDYYCIEEVKDGKKEKKFDVLEKDSHDLETGYLGIDIVNDIVNEILNSRETLVITMENAKEYGFFVGKYTFETDMMEMSSKNDAAKQIICEVFNCLTGGGEKQKANFQKELNNGEYIKCLKKIESNGIGKGRFAQLFSQKCIIENISTNIIDAINYIYEKVDI